MPEPEQKIVPEATMITDLRTGTEVAPEVVVHHAAYLQGASYNDPYPVLPAPKE